MKRKKTDFQAKNAVFWPKFFSDAIQIFYYNHDGTPKGQGFVLNKSQGGRWGVGQGPFLAQKYSLFYATPK